MNKNFKVQAQGGFTLIELIVVIVILGILAATALPKFSDLSGDARAAKLQAARASLNSVVAMTHGQFLVDPTRTSVTMEGTSVPLTLGYPSASGNLAVAAGLSTADYVISPLPSTGTTTTTTFTVVPTGVSSSNTAACTLTYTPASTTTATPTVALPSTINCN